MNLIAVEKGGVGGGICNMVFAVNSKNSEQDLMIGNVRKAL